MIAVAVLAFVGLGAGRARAPAGLRPGRGGVGADHRLPLRARSGDADVDHGRRRARRPGRRADPRTPRRWSGFEKVDTLVVDKTGTLTEGRPAVTAIRPAAGFDEAELLRLAASLERGSEHPLADAIVRAAQDGTRPGAGRGRPTSTRPVGQGRRRRRSTAGRSLLGSRPLPGRAGRRHRARWPPRPRRCAPTARPRSSSAIDGSARRRHRHRRSDQGRRTAEAIDALHADGAAAGDDDRRQPDDGAGRRAAARHRRGRGRGAAAGQGRGGRAAAGRGPGRRHGRRRRQRRPGAGRRRCRHRHGHRHRRGHRERRRHPGEGRPARASCGRAACRGR